MVHLQAHGFTVVTHEVGEAEFFRRKASAGVPRELESCHTATVGRYTVEGHVPASDIDRLLEDRPAVAGIAVPGMPIGSPGMEQGDEREPFAVYTFDREGRTAVFARH